MLTFMEYLAEVVTFGPRRGGEEAEPLLAAVRGGDQLAFGVLLDNMGENGDEIPKELEMWREPPSLASENVYVRWMIRRDLPEVLAIDWLATEDHWGEGEFITTLAASTVIGMVAEDRTAGIVLGYIIYMLQQNRIRLVRMAVHPLARRAGVGRAIMARMKGRLNFARRELAMAQSPGGMEPFLRGQGFHSSGDDFVWREE